MWRTRKFVEKLEALELRKRYIVQQCSVPREVEVREITGVLACDIHLLNLKSKAKCKFEAAG